MRTFDEHVFLESTGVEARAAAADLRGVEQPFQQAVEVVVALGQLLAGDGAGDGVAEEKHAQFDIVALAQRVGEPQRVVRTLCAVWLVVDDDEDVYRGIVARAVPAGIGRDPVSPPGDCRSSSPGAAGMSISTHRPEAAVSPATIAIAPP